MYTVRRSSRLSAKPRISYNENDSCSSMEAFRVAPEKRTSFQKMLVDETRQNFAYRNYVISFNQQKQKEINELGPRLEAEVQTNSKEKKQYDALKKFMDTVLVKKTYTMRRTEPLDDTVDSINSLIKAVSGNRYQCVILLKMLRNGVVEQKILCPASLASLMKGSSAFVAFIYFLEKINGMEYGVQYMNEFLEQNDFPFTMKYFKDTYYIERA
jgi:hypothetical protein